MTRRLRPLPRTPRLPPWMPGGQLLRYTPDGPLGGTFTCTQCAAQAWQPDLLPHARRCPYRTDPAEPR